MFSQLAEKLDDVATLCRTHGVKSLHIFGSAVGEDFDPADSDLDFAIEFEVMAPAERAAAYFGVLEGLEMLFGRSIDLISYSAIRNPYFLQSVDETKVPIYAAA